MKKLMFLLTPLFFIFFSCSSEENKLEAFNAEAFAYDIGGSWEVNATTRVRGFEQKEENETFSVFLYYEVHLVTPGGDTLKNVQSDSENVVKQEKIADTGLESQFELDSTYRAGTYTLVFDIKDISSGQKTSTATTFDLE